ncbi:Hypothetical protein OINT_2001606 [Brucella intermedia LMG 3301]|uniref:Uncharacterized protein n=1 Tax=Brucella intermedia LMG 3301 TaxID=641118 RepID=C4WQ35_9HYPH|nr:Hypothetical protein OINT_2001606 [Brucella intermedia LMG 3301]
MPTWDDRSVAHAPFAYMEITTSRFFSWLFFTQIPRNVTFMGVTVFSCSSLHIAWKR